MSPLELWALLTDPEPGFRCFWCDGKPYWLSVHDAEGFVRRHKAWHWTHNLEVGAVGFRDDGGDFACPSRVLWARVSDPTARDRLKRFRPAPTLVLGAGARRDAFWALEKGLDPRFTTLLNLRLAYNLGGLQKHASPDFRFHPPETIIRKRGRRDTPVVIKTWTSELHSAKAVAGRLKDPPEPFDWRASSGPGRAAGRT